MTESKKETETTQKENSKKQVKATTGAWWKSTVEVVDKVKPVNDAKETVASSTTEKKAKPAPKKTARKPAPSTRKKRSPATAKKTVEKDLKPVTEKPITEKPVAKKPVAKKPVAKKPVAKKPVAKKPTAKNPESVVPVKADTPEIVVAKEPEVVAETEQKAPEKKPGRGRPSRGRRGGRKKSATQATAGQQDVKVDGKEDAVAATPDIIVEARTGASNDKQPVVKLLINAEEPEECRLALLEDGRLESIHVSTVNKIQNKNNIYKARIAAIEPNLQVAFVDYGTDKNGFLPFSEIHPEYYKQDLRPEIKKLVESHQWKKLSISDVMDKGQELLVQVVKEEIGKKGANMTTYLSLPGRCVVLMPGSDSEGISRRISGEERRNQLREVMNSLTIPEGIGWIVRTASIDITKTALSKDVRFLLKLWREIKAKGQHLEGVGLLYQDYNCVMRFLREYYDPCIQEILVDGDDALEKVRDFVDMLPAKQKTVKIKQHRGARPIFNQYSVEDQIESIYQPRVNLPSGGSIVIDQTEALVAIDVNSGSTGKGKNFEDTIFQANIEAAEELARQLRLRDLGGLVVVDFIDMRSSKNIREVERKVKTAMKRDKAKVDISRISRFGLMQISRQKLGAPIESGNYLVCEHCRGRGAVRSVETQALFYFRRIHTGASRRQVTRIDCRFPLEVAEYLLNNKRQELIDLEEKYQTRVIVTADPGLKPADHEITFVKNEKEETGKKQA